MAGFRNITPWVPRYTRYGIAQRVKSNTTPGKHYIVMLRAFPSIDWKCNCYNGKSIQMVRTADPESKIEPCSHTRKVIRQWVDRKMINRVKALRDRGWEPSDIADEGVKIIATQTRHSPQNHYRGNRLKQVMTAVEFGYVYEDVNWEQSDAANVQRFFLTEAGDQRWNHLRQLRGAADIESLARVERQFGKAYNPTKTVTTIEGLTNPVNEL